MKIAARFLFISLLLSACAGPAVRHPQGVSDPLEGVHADPVAITLMRNLIKSNQELTAFKGVGNISVIPKNNATQHLRLAIAAQSPDLIRIQLSTLFGQPAATVTSNDRHLTFLSHLKNKRYSTTPDRLQGTLLPTSLTIRQLLNLLMGRIPLKKFQRLEWDPSETTEVRILVLKNRWRQTVQRIYFKHSAPLVTKIETFINDGTLEGTITFTRWRQIQTFQVPAELILNNAEGDRISLRFSRYWANPQISISAFDPPPL